MATLTTTQAGSNVGIANLFRAGYVDAVFRNNDFLGLQLNGRPVFPRLGVGDTSYRFKAVTSGNTSAAIFTEGASAPTPVAHGYSNLAVAYIYFWAWIRVSGAVRDAVRNASPAGLNVVAQEFMGTTADIRDLMNTTFMGTNATCGLETIVDSASTYAGQARGSAAWWESTETNHNGALTVAGLGDVHETARTNDKGGKTQIIFCSHNQASNYIRLSGAPNAANSSVRVEMTQAGGRGIDYSPRPDALSFMGIPIVPLPDFTTTVFVGCDLNPTGVGPGYGLSVRREFEIRGPDMSGDDDVYEISSAAALIGHMPRRDWKLTSVTA